MRKLTILLLMLLPAISTWAITLPTKLNLKPLPPVTRPHPGGIKPFSVEDDLFSAYLEEDELSIISETATGEVQVCVFSEVGAIVASESATMAPGAEISISTEDWAEGAYTLYIYYGTEVLVGEFEIINH